MIYAIFPVTILIERLQNVSLTSIHNKIPSNFRFPVIPRCLEALGKADAEVFEVTFAYQGFRGAGSDQSALNGQDQRWASVKIDAVIGLIDRQGEGLDKAPQRGKDTVEKAHFGKGRTSR